MINTRCAKGPWPVFAAAALYLLPAPTPAQMQTATPHKPSLAFSAAGPNEFVFDTGELRGKLRAQGRSQGLSEVVHVRTGVRLDSSMGLFSHYRVFSAGKRYGTGAWDWPSQATLLPDGGVVVRWASAPDRPFELSAIYRWAAPDILDLETRVLARTNLARFESFLASYFTAGFTNSEAWAGETPSREFIPAEKTAGAWQAFPRDAAAMGILRDGRWKLPPNPVEWSIMPPLARPLGLRRAPAIGLTAVLMAPKEDCFAICTPQQTDPHYAMYLSLFGQDLRPGIAAGSRARLLVREGITERDLIEAYRDYVSGR